MRLLNYTHFWILVCLINFILISGLNAWSAPVNQIQPDPVKVIVDENPPELSFPSFPSLQNKLTYRKKTWGIHLGFFNGATVNNDESINSYQIGIKISTSPLSENWEAQANISSEKILDISFSRVWRLENYEKFMDPSLKIGLINYIYSPDGLAGLININHVKIRGALAFNDILMDLERNMYIEFGTGYGATGSEFDIKLGCHF